MRSADELRELVEAYLDELDLSPELGRLGDAMAYTLRAGGKRVRPVLCLATGEAVGADPADVLPAAAAVELVHTFSLVHDDLPALDDDDERRGRPSAHVEFGEGIALLAGDALLAEAFRLALSYSTPAVARELAAATIGMIGGQYLDVTDGSSDLARLHSLKTGRLFGASVACALWVAGVAERDQVPWRAFAADAGLLFQIVDDILDDDGFVTSHGTDGARALADETAERALGRLADIPADTTTLAAVIDALRERTS